MRLNTLNMLAVMLICVSARMVTATPWMETDVEPFDKIRVDINAGNYIREQNNCTIPQGGWVYIYTDGVTIMHNAHLKVYTLDEQLLFDFEVTDGDQGWTGTRFIDIPSNIQPGSYILRFTYYDLAGDGRLCEYDFYVVPGVIDIFTQHITEPDYLSLNNYLVFESNGGLAQVDKPLLFIEGIDLSNDNSYGDYYLLADGLFQTLIADGFDIFFLEYGGGTRSVEAQASYLSETIDFIRESALDAPITMIGLSMGGLVARYALADASSAGEPLDVDLFISVDSPQLGAVIDADFQRNLVELNHLGSLGSIAAKQLLMNSVVDEESMHQQLMQDLHLMTNGGYSSTTRNVGISYGEFCDPLCLNQNDNTGLVWMQVHTEIFAQPLNVYYEIDGDAQTSSNGSLLPVQMGVSKGSLGYTNTYETIRHSNPTFIPSWSATDIRIIDGQLASGFDQTYYCSENNFHDSFPPELIEPLMSELNCIYENHIPVFNATSEQFQDPTNPIVFSASIDEMCYLDVVELSYRYENDVEYTVVNMEPSESGWQYSVSLLPFSTVRYVVTARSEYGDVFESDQYSLYVGEQFDGELHVSTGDQLSDIAPFVRACDIYIDADISLSSSAVFSSVADVVVHGPAIVTMSPQSRIIAPSGSQVELHYLDFVSETPNTTGVALSGAFTGIDHCQFSNFHTCLSGSSANDFMLSWVTVSDCQNFVDISQVLSGKTFRIVNSEISFESRSIWIGGNSGEIRAQNVDFYYTGSDEESSQFYSYLSDGGNAELLNCQFFDGASFDIGGDYTGTEYWKFDGCVFHEQAFPPVIGRSGTRMHTSLSVVPVDVIIVDTSIENLALIDRSSVYYAGSSMSIEDCQLRGFGPDGGSFVFPDTIPFGQAIYTSCVNTLFEDVVIDMAELSDSVIDPAHVFDHCTFVRENVANSLMNISQQAHISVTRSIMHGTMVYTGGIHDDRDYDFANSFFTDADALDEFGSGDNCITGAEGPKFVSPLLGDYRLRFDSPCLDRSDETEREFDLTLKDLGWKPTLVRLQVDGGAGRMAVDPTTPAEYEITAPSQLTCDVIPDGTVIRVSRGASLTLLSSAGLTVGNPTGGERVSIVGSDVWNGEECDFIEIAGPDGAMAPATFNGALFNIAPVNSEPGIDRPWLTLRNLDLELDAAKVTFVDYTEAELTLSNCAGVLRGFAGDDLKFGSSGNPGFLFLNTSAVRVVNCDFAAQDVNSDANSRLSIFGTPANGASTEVVGCSIENSEGNDEDFLNLSSTAVELRNVDFLNFDNTVICQTHSAVRMDHGAACVLEITDDQTDEPLVEMIGGDLDLFCGFNQLLHYSYDPLGWISSFVRYTADGDPAPYVYDWRNNAWGSTCEELESVESRLEYPDVPEWAQVVAPLSICPEVITPCGDWENDPLALLKAGKEVEKDFPSVARAYYVALCEQHPKAKEVTEASNRLKVVGQTGDYGADNYEGLRDNLFELADISETWSKHQQAVLQDCNGWLVEGYHGDRAAVKQSLLAMKTGETDPVCLKTIDTSIDELVSYPLQGGGLSSLAPRVQQAKRFVRNQATRQLFFGGGPLVGADSESEALPTSLAIVSCYPNPFNPTLTVQFDLPQDGPVHVKAFNLLGQQVALLMNGPLDAGRHQTRFDGSQLSTGMYIIQVESPASGSVTQKVMLLK